MLSTLNVFAVDRALILSFDGQMSASTAEPWLKGLKQLGWYVKTMGPLDPNYLEYADLGEYLPPMEHAELTEETLVKALTDEVATAQKTKNNFLLLIASHGECYRSLDIPTLEWKKNFRNYKSVFALDEKVKFGKIAGFLKLIDHFNGQSSVIFVNINCNGGSSIPYFAHSSICALNASSDVKIASSENYIIHMGELLALRGLSDYRLKTVVSQSLLRLNQSLSNFEPEFRDLHIDDYPYFFSQGFGFESLNVSDLQLWFRRYSSLPIIKDKRLAEMMGIADKRDPNCKIRRIKFEADFEKRHFEILMKNQRVKAFVTEHKDDLEEAIMALEDLLVFHEIDQIAPNLVACRHTTVKTPCETALQLWNLLSKQEKTTLKAECLKKSVKNSSYIYKESGSDAFDLVNYYNQSMSEAFAQSKGKCAEFDLNRKAHFVRDQLQTH